MTLLEILSSRLQPFGLLLQLLFGRVLFSSLAISVLTAVISRARARLSFVVRSWLWACCIPALFLPFEHSVVYLTNKQDMFSLLQSFAAAGVLGKLLMILPMIISIIWFFGMIAHAVKTGAGYLVTLKLIKAGGISFCAAYFFRFRSHIYLPPRFEQNYTTEEREMLLAHEKQHVKQRDPLLFCAMQWLLCALWFCPAARKAVRLIRRDRELLCDQRAACGFSRRDYGRLLLREAAKSAPEAVIAGIAADEGGMYERINACVAPFAGAKKVAAAISVIAACVLVFGTLGLVHPIIHSPMKVQIFRLNGSELVPFEEAERFVSLTEETAIVDTVGLLEFATAQDVENELYFMVSCDRATLFTHYTTSVGNKISKFTGSQLLNLDTFAENDVWSLILGIL